VNDRLPGWFELLVPSALHRLRPQSHRWIVDIKFVEHLIPRHPALGKIIIGGPNVGDARAGIECVSYMCPGVVVIGGYIQTNILRSGQRNSHLRGGGQPKLYRALTGKGVGSGIAGEPMNVTKSVATEQGPCVQFAIALLD
jgi:hypothetical protein